MRISNGPGSGSLLEENRVNLEPYSRRMKVYKLPKNNFKRKIKDLKEVAKEQKCDKLIFYAKEGEKKLFQKNDIDDAYPEGEIKGFFGGEDAHILSIFLDPERRKFNPNDEENKIMRMIKQKNYVGNENDSLPQGYRMKIPTENDVRRMAELYDTVFETYPTPMNDPEFVLEMVRSPNLHFTLVEYGGEIVSACSADILSEFNSAEMTDCATLSEHRGKGLLSCQFLYLLKKLQRQGLQTLFSYSRSGSVGMNLVNIKHGFTYGGRMIRNSNISGSLENMNIWYKTFE